MKKLTETTKIELENMIDAYGLVAVLESIADIAGEKAAHIAVNWQDAKTASCWERVASKLWSVSTTAETYVGR
jgi:hypothetical protein